MSVRDDRTTGLDIVRSALTVKLMLDVRGDRDLALAELAQLRALARQVEKLARRLPTNLPKAPPAGSRDTLTALLAAAYPSRSKENR